MEFLKLLISIILCQFAGFIGAFYTKNAIQDWYVYIAKPSFTPPDWVFAPVWITLYFLMGISAFLVWRKININKMVKPAMIVFFIQLVLNALWSILFFGFKSPLSAFIEIIILLLMILLTIILFFRISKIAGYILIPYVIWVGFAALLNYSIWKLN